jgi:hypothetical protein
VRALRIELRTFLLPLFVIAAIPAELTLVTRAVQRSGHASLLFSAAAIDAVLLSSVTLFLAARRTGGWRALGLTPARLVRLALIAAALFVALCRAAGMPLPRALAFVSVAAELALFALVAAGAKRAAAFLPRPAVAAAATEVAILRAAGRALLRRPIVPDGELHTTTRTSELGRLYVAFAMLSLVELPLLHVLLRARLGPGHLALHLGLAALHLWGLAWLAGELRLLGETGHRVTDGALELHLGIRARARIDRASIASIERLADAPARDSSSLTLTPRERPNLLVVLRAPVAVERPFGRVRQSARLRLYVDDPDRLIAALANS